LFQTLRLLPREVPPALQVQFIDMRYNTVLKDKFKEGTPSPNRSFACGYVSVLATAKVCYKKYSPEQNS
jgi:hypothetical protein